MTYGIMPEKDYESLDKLLWLVTSIFPEPDIHTLEIGVHKGNTSRGIKRCLEELYRTCHHTGIDNQHDFKMGSPFPECNFIVGNSVEVYKQVPDDSQHFIFIDGNHSLLFTMCDFLLYKAKLKENGILAFHDCGKQIQPFTDYQGIGARENPDNFISCRNAVEKLGLLNGELQGWKIVLDEYDPQFHTGGIFAVKKTFDKEWLRQAWWTPENYHK